MRRSRCVTILGIILIIVWIVLLQQGLTYIMAYSMNQKPLPEGWTIQDYREAYYALNMQNLILSLIAGSLMVWFILPVANSILSLVERVLIFFKIQLKWSPSELGDE